MRKEKEYMICSIYDTETTNVGKGNETRAYCILYIFNDIRFKDLKNYTLDKDDNIKFYRTEKEALAYIDELVTFGIKANVIPIICAYNLMFDLQTLIYDLNMKYDITTNAQ